VKLIIAILLIIFSIKEIVPSVQKTLAGNTGAFIGSRLIKKITLRFVQVLIAVLLMLVSVALGIGII